MDERAEKAKRRFENMLADARAAVAEASGGSPSRQLSPRALLVATKALNRAGGFLEAVSITVPELGRELIEQFESFAAEVDQPSVSAAPAAEPHAGTERRLTNDRRGWERRLERDRRHQHVQVLTDRRASSERRAQVDRRTGHAREMADRRFRSLAP